jgi:hypothetical protein
MPDIQGLLPWLATSDSTLAFFVRMGIIFTVSVGLPLLAFIVWHCWRFGIVLSVRKRDIFQGERNIRFPRNAMVKLKNGSWEIVKRPELGFVRAVWTGPVLDRGRAHNFDEIVEIVRPGDPTYFELLGKHLHLQLS